MTNSPGDSRTGRVMAPPALNDFRQVDRLPAHVITGWDNSGTVPNDSHCLLLLVVVLAPGFFAADFRLAVFNSTRITSMSLSVRFSGKCFTAGFQTACPGAMSLFSVLPPG